MKELPTLNELSSGEERPIFSLSSCYTYTGSKILLLWVFAQVFLLEVMYTRKHKCEFCLPGKYKHHSLLCPSFSQLYILQIEIPPVCGTVKAQFSCLSPASFSGPQGFKVLRAESRIRSIWGDFCFSLFHRVSCGTLHNTGVQEILLNGNGERN